MTMKKTLLALTLVSTSVCLQAQTKKPVAKPATKTVVKPGAKPPVKPAAAVKPLKNLIDSVSYAFGISLGEFLKSQEIKKVNFTMLNMAITQTLNGQTPYMNMQQANDVLSTLQNAKKEKIAGAEKAKSAKFLDENKKRPGIMVTPSGLQYEIMTKGNGAIPASADTIVAHYAGTLMDGKEFDNSYKRGEPITIPVTGVIAGWTEALQLMPVGSKWKLFIPSDLAYGDYGAGGDIPGGAALVFEIELLGIKGK